MINSRTIKHATSIPRRSLLLAAVAVLALPTLQGCMPVVVGGAAVGAASMMGDRRTSGAYLEDEAIEWKTRSQLSNRFGNTIKVSVTSYNRNVLLTGQVPDEATRAEVGRIASGIDNVRGVVNEVEIAALSSLTAQSNDALITSRVKARFVDDSSFAVNHVKVVTEAGTVFLMGIVTRREADSATEVARTTSGVQKVVRVFEYITDAEATSMGGQTQSQN